MEDVVALLETLELVLLIKVELLRVLEVWLLALSSSIIKERSCLTAFYEILIFFFSKAVKINLLWSSVSDMGALIFKYSVVIFCFWKLLLN